jgi:hypothetical protein
MQVLPDKVAEVGKFIKDAAEQNHKHELAEMLLTIRDGLNRDFQESLYSYFKSNSPDTIKKIEKLLPEVYEEVDQHNNKTYLLFGRPETISLHIEAGRMAASEVAESGTFGSDDAKRRLIQLVLQDCINVDKKPLTVGRCVESMNEHLKLFGLNGKDKISFVRNPEDKGGTLVLLDSTGKKLDSIDVPVDSNAGDKLEPDTR